MTLSHFPRLAKDCAVRSANSGVREVSRTGDGTPTCPPPLVSRGVDILQITENFKETNTPTSKCWKLLLLPGGTRNQLLGWIVANSIQECCREWSHGDV